MRRLSREIVAFKDVFGDFEGGEGFEECRPVREDEVGGEGDDRGKEDRSFAGGFAGFLPRRFEEIEDGMPGEGQQVEGGEVHCQKLFAVTEVVRQFIAVIFKDVETFVFDFPSGPAAGDDFGDIFF